MKFNLKTPCKECPFTKGSLPGWLGGETLQDTYDQVMHEGPFACHMTRHKKDKDMSRCFGSLMFMRKGCKSPKYDIQLKGAVNKIEMKGTENILSVREFFVHHNT